MLEMVEECNRIVKSSLMIRVWHQSTFSKHHVTRTVHIQTGKATGYVTFQFSLQKKKTWCWPPNSYRNKTKPFAFLGHFDLPRSPTKYEEVFESHPGRLTDANGEAFRSGRKMCFVSWNEMGGCFFHDKMSKLCSSIEMVGLWMEV